MIGRRVLAAAGAVALIVVLGGGGPRPEIARDANAAIVAAADDSLVAIDRLERELAPALDAARMGGARVVAGESDPAEPLVSASDGLVSAAPAATELRNALARLERARAALEPGAERLPTAPDAEQLLSIAGQLASTADAGASFAEMRRGAESVSGSVVDALDAAADGRLDEADDHLAASLVAVDAVRDLEESAPALTVWIDTADAMIGAVQELVDAVRTGDVERANAAQAGFDAAAEGAAEADRALRIGLGETGNAISAVPLQRLAEVRVELRDLEAAVTAARTEAGG
jgi:hypothetical protein